MAKNDMFHCSVITPERAVLETEATFVAFPAHDGEVGILPGRAPLLFKMGIGELRVESPEGNHNYFVDGGFAQMVENRLTLLTEQARAIEEIDKAAAERALAEARTLPMVTDAEFAARQRAVRRAETQIHLAEANR
ncbi:MAG TPA: ATP synthase F1 subunit epsilon [Thermoanaerobaculia bacterium]|jgi:F-type H+-transporting ATPase subunit epsilon|nr:ATP synthase F1 subunit epsilon [Thermoanaerobaculia bacterium]